MTKRYIGVGTWKATPEIRQQINEVLDSGRISYGPKSREFEQRIATMHGDRYGVLSNSGTSSLHVALQTLKEIHGWEDGDEVFVPASTFVATVNVVLHNGLKPVLIDVEPGTYAISTKHINYELDRRYHWPKCIIPVNPFGQPADLQNMSYLRRRIKVIDDSCECILARHCQKPIGDYADITCFSFYVAHLITTGVGGMATTKDEHYAVKMRSLVNHGRDNIYICMDDSHPDRLKEVIGRRFSFPSIGHSYRITELESAIGLAQLDTIADVIAYRQKYAVALRQELSLIAGGRLSFLTDRPDTENSWMMFPIVVESEKFTKMDICNFLEERGIETRDALPVIFQPCYKGMWDPYDYPIAKKLWERGFYIGCHQGLTDDDFDYTISTFKEFLDGRA